MMTKATIHPQQIASSHFARTMAHLEWMMGSRELARQNAWTWTNSRPAKNLKAATDDADGVDGERRGELSLGPSQMEAAICEGLPGAHMLPGLF